MAEQSGISAAVLQEIENGLRNPSQTILQSIAGALRLSAETLLLQAGVLDPQDTDEINAVREIRRDPNLTERQREMLVEIYDAFCAANRDARDEVSARERERSAGRQQVSNTRLSTSFLGPGL